MNKAKKRILLKTEEVKQYDRQQRNKNKMMDRLDMLGYREEKAYRDCVSYYAW